MAPLKLGIVGVGGMGASHARAMKNLDEIELVAVADLDAMAALLVAEATDSAAFTEMPSFFESGIEAVLIATPHPFHSKIAIAAAKRGLHVLSEKPLAVTVAQGDKMVAACRSAGVLLGVMFQQRAEPARRTLKKMVEQGAIGEIYRIEMSAPWYRTQSYYDASAWRGTWHGEGGGVLMNQAPHSLDQFLWMGGAPLRVQALAGTRLHNIEVENTCTALCDYGAGKTGVFYASTADLPAPERFEVRGDKGALRLENNVLSLIENERSLAAHLSSATTSSGDLGGRWREIPTENTTRLHDEVVRAFARAVRASDASLMLASGEDGLAALELANAFLLAGLTRREVALPLNRATYARFLARLRAAS